LKSGADGEVVSAGGLGAPGWRELVNRPGAPSVLWAIALCAAPRRCGTGAPARWPPATWVARR
jgi:hypothetical protein